LEFNGVTEEIDGQKFARCDEIFAAAVVDLPAANPTGLFSQDNGSNGSSFLDWLKGKLAGGYDNLPDELKWPIQTMLQCQENEARLANLSLFEAKDTEKPYGDVEYADPGYQEDKQHRYPIDTEEHVRAAWSYVNQSDNASKYNSDDLTKIKSRIKSAAKKFGIEISESNNQSMELTKENLTAIGTAVAEALKPGFESISNAFRAKQGNEDNSDPTAEEITAAGCTDDMTDDQKKSAVMEWRAKKADKPVTNRDLLQMFRFTGGKPAKASGGVTKQDKDNANGEHAFESLVTKFRTAGMKDGTARLAARKENPKAYNDWCQRGSPEIKDQANENK
jgi:hypothetical protein